MKKIFLSLEMDESELMAKLDTLDPPDFGDGPVCDRTLTGTIDEQMGRIVVNLPEGQFMAKYRGEPLTPARLRQLGIGIGDNATFSYDPAKHAADLILAGDDSDYSEYDASFG